MQIAPDAGGSDPDRPGPGPGPGPADECRALRFAACWRDGATAPRPSAAHGDITLLMVRGLFGAWIPGHFRAPSRLLQRLGWDLAIARTDPAGTLADNARGLAGQIDALCARGRRPLFMAHSKGGLEVLIALAGAPQRAAATAGFIGVQVPRAGAPYLESLFSKRHRATRRPLDHARETLEAALLTLTGARAACTELDSTQVGAVVGALDRQRWPFDRLLVATCAQHPSRSLELRHARLGRIHPGAAHDGVFRTVDQVWPATRMLSLTGIDHAQPSVGGLGFAHDRFWAALLRLLLDPGDAAA